MQAVRFLCLVFMSALLLALPAPAGAEVTFEVRSWRADLAGVIQIGDTAPVDEIDLVADLGLETEDDFEGRLLIRPSRRTMLRLAWLPLSFAGEEIVSRTITFFGRDFTVSRRVLSELELDYGRLGFAWQFLSTRDGRYRIGPLIEAKGFRGEATLSAPDPPLAVTESGEFETAFASAGLVADLEPSERLHLFAEASVLVDTNDGDLLDAEGGVRFYPLDWLAIVGGYRILEVDAGDGDERLDIEIEGAFFGLALRF